MIRKAKREDAAAIAEIYNHYIQHSIATFELEPVSAEEMYERIEDVQLDHEWLVYEDQIVLGYAYACRWKPRAAYDNTAEISVYLSHVAHGKGIGKKLYQEVITLMKEKDLHTLIGGISLPNEASQRLHESLGFEKVAHFSETGFKFGKWIDVGYWQLILD